MYYEVPYEKGKKNGIQKTYYENGSLLAETPYKNGSIGIGTKEYTNKNILVEKPTLKIWYTKEGQNINVYAKVLRNGKITKRVSFYEGLLVNGKYYHKYLKKLTIDKNGIAKATFYKNPEVVSISAKVESAKSIYTLINEKIKTK